MRQVAREVPVFVVVPPNVLLLDVAGPMEVLRKANLEQDAVRFVAAMSGRPQSLAARSACRSRVSRRCPSGFPMARWW